MLEVNIEDRSSFNLLKLRNEHFFSVLVKEKEIGRLKPCQTLSSILGGEEGLVYESQSRLTEFINGIGFENLIQAKAVIEYELNN